MPHINHKDDEHIIHTVLLKFGQWDIREQNGRKEIICWKCPICNQSKLLNSVEYFNSHIVTHILSHTLVGKSAHDSVADYDLIYVIFLYYLQSYLINYTAEAFDDENKMIKNMLIKNQMYGYDPVCEPYSHVQLDEMHFITTACAFCGHQYMHRPTDEIIIEHAAMCFNTACVKNHN